VELTHLAFFKVLALYERRAMARDGGGHSID
jgi:hypothetical protein